MKMHYRRCAMLLALLCTAAAMTACGGEGEPTPIGTNEDTAAAVESGTEERWQDGLPETLDLGGKTFVIHSRGDEGPNLEIDAETEVGEVLNDAIFQRNRGLEERLNMKLKLFPGGSWENYGQDITQIRASIAAGDNAWQMISVWGIASSQLVLDNCFYDLTDMPYLDSSAPWWNQSAVQALTLAGKRFLMVGDTSVLSMLGGAFVMYINDTMCQKYEIDDIHALVRDGKWTFQKMTEYSRLAMADLDGSGKMDENDQYGLLFAPYNTADSLYTSADIHQIVMNDGMPEYTPSADRLTKLMDILYPLCFDREMYGSFMNLDGLMVNPMFISGQGLMAISTLNGARTTFREMEDNYTIVPLPKLDEMQENYLTPAYNGACLWGIPSDNPDPESAAAVMEAMAAASHYEITPVYFKTCLQEKYARSEETVEMLEIIRDTQYVDAEFLWRDALGNVAYTARNMIAEQTDDVASWLAKNEKSVLSSIEKTVEALEAIQNE